MEIYSFCLLIFSCCSFSFNQKDNFTLPVRISTAQVDFNVCPLKSSIGANLNDTKTKIRQSIRDNIDSVLDEDYAPPHPCNGTGWTRVAFLNMTDPNEVCPSNLTFYSSPVRGCGQNLNSNNLCDSVIYTLNGLRYSRVCGRILAYQKGAPEAFYNFVANNQISIESLYVEGVSLTRGPAGSRQHIWTFTAARIERDSVTKYNCPCSNTLYSWPYQLPLFLRNNYFCETGNPGPVIDLTAYYFNDTLWDGEGCGPSSTCCQFNNPPWFQVALPQTTSDDIELRLCLDYHSHDEDVLLYLVDIYVR